MPGAFVTEDGAQDLVGFLIGPTTRLPDVCLQCGQPTHRRVKVKRVGPRPPAEKVEPSSMQTALGCLPSVGCLFTLLFFSASLFQRRGPPPPVVRVRVPQCRDCAKGGKPEPLGVQYELKTFRFDVHPRFANWAAQEKRSAARVAAPPRGDERRS
jgi:hypothetical protein